MEEKGRWRRPNDVCVFPFYPDLIALNVSCVLPVILCVLLFYLGRCLMWMPDFLCFLSAAWSALRACSMILKFYLLLSVCREHYCSFVPHCILWPQGCPWCDASLECTLLFVSLPLLPRFFPSLFLWSTSGSFGSSSCLVSSTAIPSFPASPSFYHLFFCLSFLPPSFLFLPMAFISTCSSFLSLGRESLFVSSLITGGMICGCFLIIIQVAYKRKRR